MSLNSHSIAARLGALTLGIAFALAGVPALAQSSQQHTAATKRADLRGETVSVDVQHIADWAVHSRDHKGLPFIVVDKVNARAAAFDRHGQLIRTTPVLIGIGVGDVFAPGVRELEMHQTQPWQRITPAGRYFAEEDLNLQGERVLWVDYDAGIAIHRMPKKKTAQRRQERMVSADPADHRITYGCINVPASFYDQVVQRQFGRRGGMVYVLPDTLPLKSVFNSYDIDDTRQVVRAGQTAPAPTQATRRF